MNEAFLENSNLYKDVTNVHPLGLAAVLVLGLCLILVPRRWSVLPMMMIACFIPSAQKITVLNLDFDLLRIMVLFGFMRLLVRKEYKSFHFKLIDKVIFSWVASMVLFYTFQHGTVTALVNRLGVAFNAIGMYFLFRCLIRNWTDADTVIFGVIMLSIPVAGAFFVEYRTGRNIFSVFGGVPEITLVRDGRLRCQGAFSHPILAGCYWVSLLPLFVARFWKSRKDRIWAFIGFVTCTLIVFFCASSTPAMGWLAAVVGGFVFLLRYQMKLIRWSIFLGLVALHIVMEAPVWHLIARVSAVGGSTSWHRYNLINQTIIHFDEWFLTGIQSTLHWGVVDITNQYVLEAIRGGCVTLLLFVCMICVAYRNVGILWRIQCHPYKIAFSWALGVSLFVHTVDFVGVSYFGQIYIVWYLLLAMIGSLVPSSETGRLAAKSA